MSCDTGMIAPRSEPDPRARGASDIPANERRPRRRAFRAGGPALYRDGARRHHKRTARRRSARTR